MTPNGDHFPGWAPVRASGVIRHQPHGPARPGPMPSSSRMRGHQHAASGQPASIRPPMTLRRATRAARSLQMPSPKSRRWPPTASRRAPVRSRSWPPIPPQRRHSTCAASGLLPSLPCRFTLHPAGTNPTPKPFTGAMVMSGTNTQGLSGMNAQLQPTKCPPGSPALAPLPQAALACVTCMACLSFALGTLDPRVPTARAGAWAAHFPDRRQPAAASRHRITRTAASPRKKIRRRVLCSRESSPACLTLTARAPPEASQPSNPVQEQTE